MAGKTNEKLITPRSGPTNTHEKKLRSHYSVSYKSLIVFKFVTALKRICMYTSVNECKEESTKWPMKKSDTTNT